MKVKLGVTIFFLIVGSLLIVFGLDLISSGEWLDKSYGQIILPVGIVITSLASLGCIVVLIRRKKARDYSIDAQMKRVLNFSIGLLICGWTLFIILGSLTSFQIYRQSPYNLFGFIGIIGLLIGFIGLYGIIIYRFYPEKLRNYLQERKKSNASGSSEGDI